MRVAINLLTDDPVNPSGAHWFWTRVIPEMAKRLTDGESFHLMVSPKSRPTHSGYGRGVDYITYPWSNEKRNLRTLSEHVYSPLRLPLGKIDVLNTLMAPIVRSAPKLVVHIKTLHAYTTPQAITPAARLYRQLSYPRTARLADAIILNSRSLVDEVQQYLKVDPAKIRLIPEAVDHDLFRPGDRDEAFEHVSRRYGVRENFVLFVSSLWPYKNCEGLIRAFAAAKSELGGRQLVVVGPGRDTEYVGELKALASELGVAGDIVWVGGVPLEETVHFYRAADVFVYPSHNETFGLPILEAMASACPVVTSNVTAMPETAGGAALLADPKDSDSIADQIVKACGPEGERLRLRGPERAGEFTWAATAERTLEVYREVHEGHAE
ncbi:glycosyltransferase involved in cell wall biosynthesis [Amycolatopsis endophytica]|uniref:Glycosyltransferase involved in cell wall biosynthesis n=1 Tax=Amycolatopsis endophytica TaxID=860233 RepID=A0A853AZ56_9PSEU|nr:glycosyltransferase family 1 protein [Amycolatopsis endophytica]NYI87915.1 glycosyltransferase involved in cell wall biosynthesis [Amycolatopsis endophytica]